MSKPVQQQIGNIALVVENYDDAIEFYTQKLQFTLVEDTDLGGGKRWVQVSPPNSNGVVFLEEPRVEEYGTVVVFQDLYGTKWDLLQLNSPTS
ncbi:VOC family protein [Vibrio jasicida]|uniref:VOC family protein n=1 Tax=Vibrio jasicida TaxID=766224 RepID=UPI0039096BF3